jgi:hypothetical protein
VDWDPVEADLGTRLPRDYKAVIETYGPGAFGDFLSVFQPVTPFLTNELAYQSRRSAEVLNSLRNELIPFAPVELLAVARTDNGDTVYWVKEPCDEPDWWTIIGNAARNTTWPFFSGGLAAFLHEVLSGRLRYPIFPDSFPGQKPRFIPGGRPDPRRVAALRTQGLYRDRDR